MSDDDIVNTNLASYEVRHAGAERQLREIANVLNSVMQPGWGFTLFLFEYGDEVDHGAMFYISSSDRADMLKALKEFIAKQEQQQGS